ncbi:hypothetical protein AB4144_19125 [Rhizobiaceae sp. 2RAB30]
MNEGDALITDDLPRVISSFLATSLAQLGRLDETRAEVEMFLVGNPHFTTRHWASTEPFRDTRAFHRLATTR